jgi:5'-nucleotidase
MSTDRPLILLTNDDGIHATGLQKLEEAMSRVGDIVVVAPDRERSGVGHAISLHRPLRLRRLEQNRYMVDGTPTDCVYVSLNRLMKDNLPALVVSGINRGGNLGDDITYSGTVAGAFEATILGVPGMAVSLADVCTEGYDVAADFAERLARKVLAEGLPRGVFLNVNVPYRDEAPTRYQVTRMGKRHYGNIVHERFDPRGQPYYWIGGERVEAMRLPDSDCDAMRDNVISVTPVQLDMTAYASVPLIDGWRFDGYAHADTAAGAADRVDREDGAA